MDSLSVWCRFSYEHSPPHPAVQAVLPFFIPRVVCLLGLVASTTVVSALGAATAWLWMAMWILRWPFRDVCFCFLQAKFVLRILFEVSVARAVSTVEWSASLLSLPPNLLFRYLPEFLSWAVRWRVWCLRPTDEIAAQLAIQMGETTKPSSLTFLM